jgi:anaerobic selenocysteine-containing dehydrogenase
VLTDSGKVELAPQNYVDTFRQNAQRLFADELARRQEFKLVGKREIKRMNTASANVPRLVKDDTNYAWLNDSDAREIGVRAGEKVTVRSAFGSIQIPVKVSDEMMPRTVAIPQCWGHKDAQGLSHARAHPGVNSNFLAGDGADNIEKLSGMSHLSGIFVEIERVGA